MKPKIDIKIVKETAWLLKCIGHPDRLRLVELLERGRLSVGEMTKKLRMDQAVVSKHLAVLKGCKIVESEVEGNFRYYSISDPNVIHILKCMTNQSQSGRDKK